MDLNYNIREIDFNKSKRNINNHMSPKFRCWFKLNLEFVLEKLNNFKYQKQIKIFKTNIIK